RVELRLRQRMCREELATALELRAALGERGFGGRELRAGLDAVELDEHGALLHELAFAEVNRGDGVHRLRGHLGRLVRAGIADGLDFETELAHRRFRGDDADLLIGRATTEPAGCTGTTGTAAAGTTGLSAHRRLAVRARRRGSTAVRATSNHTQH